MKDYSKMAEQILNLVGGIENVRQLEHCATRLRFVLDDSEKADTEALKKVEGVMGVVKAAQFQVVIGNDVTEVFDRLKKLLGDTEDNSGVRQEKKKEKISSIVLDFIVAVFQPLVPAIAGAGILKALLTLLVWAGLMTDTSSIYQFLFNAADAAMYYLPMAVAVTAATKLGCNKLVALSIAGAMLLPGLTEQIANGMAIFGFEIQNISYSSQVFPIILAVLFLYIVEKYATQICPRAVRVFVVPLVCYVIVVPATFLFLGPIGYNAGQIFTDILVFLYGKAGWLAVAVLGGVLPFMISVGMHKPLVPYLISAMSSMGYEIMYASASLTHNLAESGGCFAVAVRTKDEKLRATAISGGVSALFGITEPALYGVTIQNKRVLGAVSLASAVSGGFMGIMAVKCFVVANPGLASMAIYVDPDNAMNIVWAFAGLLLALILGFVITIFTFKENVQKVKGNEKEKNKENVSAVTDRTEEHTGEKLSSPVEGKLIPLDEVKDEVFSQGILGIGAAVIPTAGEIYAPANGIVETVTDTKHAIGIRTDGGAELLIHVGLDTVQLNGKGFELLTDTGRRVTAGDVLIRFDREAIQQAGYDITTPIVVANGDDFKIKISEYGEVKKEDTIMSLEGKEV